MVRIKVRVKGKTNSIRSSRASRAQRIRVKVRVMGQGYGPELWL